LTKSAERAIMPPTTTGNPGNVGSNGSLGAPGGAFHRPGAQEIVTRADGNPFFLEQLALHTGQARDLRSDLMVPNTIHDVADRFISSIQPLC
jgi:hypothetical protein